MNVQYPISNIQLTSPTSNAAYVGLHYFTGSLLPLAVSITAKPAPDTEEICCATRNKLFTLLSSDEVVTSLAQTLSEELEEAIKLINIKTASEGSIQVDMILGDLSQIDYLKELSDKWVLSNMVDSILMTPQFIESCHAEDVAVEFLIDEDSYQQIKTFHSE